MIDYAARQPVLTNGYQNYMTPPPPPAPRRTRIRATTVALSVLAATLLVLAGVLTALFVSASGDHDTVSARLADQKEKLASVQERVTSTGAEREQAEQRNDALETANTQLSDCVNAVRDFLWNSPTTVAAQAAIDLMDAECQ